jgi:F-type H+-transporting ATPase subunit a
MDLAPSYLYALNSLIVAAILFVTGVAAVSKATKIPGRLQIFVEIIVDFLNTTFKQALGPGNEGFVMLPMTLFLFVILSNFIGQLPWPYSLHIPGSADHVHFYFISPTATPSTTVGFGLMIFLYVQYLGIRRNGLVGYLKHFWGPIAILGPLLFTIEVISECAKPFSLGMRLFGNIYAEDILNQMASQSGIPGQIVVYILQVFSDVVQALIFALLSCAYISLMCTSHADSGDEHSGSHAATGDAARGAAKA